ncbi:hypothetical protein [Salsipaludibacter albus]|uniref:hypothetical protein n=1 Tax=Salsipaludibacter albus TaxID=2849650 RepID=UPI001EE3EA72|nr:hypothetical protein [Salsipaludibacter albus]MBY5161486.1 hypothetical protein [Salsipaludibacter albus]
MTADGADRGLQARDIVAFGQEFGRVLSDGRIIGRAEPFAKVFPSSRAVKRAVGPIAWAILEDIALDARLDDAGRLVAETNVRRLADNLGLANNTVTKHLGRLRDHGFVLHEEHREAGSGMYAASRYVLDPSACLERFTHTPPSGATAASTPNRAAVDNSHDVSSTHNPATVDNSAAESTDRAESSTDDVSRPCRNSCDTVPSTVSQSTRHRDLRHNREVVVGEEEQQQTARESNDEPPPTSRLGEPEQDFSSAVADDPTDLDSSHELEGDPGEHAELIERLVSVGVADGQARSLIAAHPVAQVVDVLDAVEVTEARSPAGWVVTAIRDGWDVSQAAEQLRSERKARRLRARDGALRRLARQREDRQLDRSTRWEAAVSGALDNDQLARALEVHTSPLAGVVGRRSVPVATAQIVGWAVAAHRADPGAPLADLLPRLLAGDPTPAPGSRGSSGPASRPPGVEESLPEPPTQTGPAAPLRARVARLLPDLDTPTTERTTTASRSLEPR